jgi:hypothetical protein
LRCFCANDNFFATSLRRYALLRPLSVEKFDLFEDEEKDDDFEDIGTPLPKVTISLSNISAYDALNIICRQTELDWKIENSVVIIFKPEYQFIYEDWEYNGKFHKLIDLADRIVIRDGGFNCCGPVDEQKILLEIKNPKQIKKLNKIIRFDKKQEGGECDCCGYPGIDWYRGDYRLALTGIKHGSGLCGRDFPTEALLTKESSKKLAKWLLDHNIPDQRDELKKIVENNEEQE